MFPGWFAGFAFAAIAIGALMPASIMAIACGNLFTRNIFKEFIAPDCKPQTEAKVAKLVAFLAKLGALFFVLEIADDLRHPASASGRHLDLPDRAGGAAGALCAAGSAGAAGGMGGRRGLRHLDGDRSWASKAPPIRCTFSALTVPCYAAVSALIANLLVSWLLTLVFRATVGPSVRDETAPEDYV